MTQTPDGWERSVWIDFKAKDPEGAKIYEWFQKTPARREAREAFLEDYLSKPAAYVDGHISPYITTHTNGKTYYKIIPSGIDSAANSLRDGTPIGECLIDSVKYRYGKNSACSDNTTGGHSDRMGRLIDILRRIDIDK